MYATVTSLTGPAGGTVLTGWPETPTTTIMPEPGKTPERIPAQRSPVDDGSWPLAHQPEAVADARHLAQAVLEDWHVTEEVQDGVLLVVSELVTNSVEHAVAPVVLYLHREHTNHRIWIGVTDGGPATRDGEWTRSCTQDEHGRGLTVVKALAEAHGQRTRISGRSTRWARINPAAA